MKEIFIRCGKSDFFRVLLTNIVIGLTQGAGLILLLPLIQILGPAANSDNNISQAISGFFESVNLEISVYSIVAIYIVIISLIVLLRQYQRVLSSKITQNYISHLRTKLFNHISNASWAFILNQKRSALFHSLTQDISKVGVTSFNMLNIISSSIIILINVLVAVLIDPFFTLITVAFSVILSYLSKPFMEKALDQGVLSRNYHKDIYTGVNEMLQGLKNVKSHNLEQDVQQNFADKSQNMVQHVIAFSRTQASTAAFHGILSAITLGAYFLLSVQLLKIPIASLVVLVIIFARLVPKFTGLVGSWQKVRNAMPAFEGLDNLMKEAEENKEIHSNKRDKPTFSDSLQLSNVSYQYPGAFQLKEVSLQIKYGTVVALAGISGSGKTTIADLISGLIKPDSGEIIIDGNTLKDSGFQHWRTSLSYVTQEPYFFNGTVKENLLLGCSGKISDEEIWKTLEDCLLADRIRKSDSGINAVIGEQGLKLSGGERQRLAIARALLRKPSLLLLDEATSALDYENENKILKTIFKQKAKLTVVIIAHRLSTLKNVDEIFVLHNGTLAEKGNWNELMQQPGKLKSLADQSRFE